MYTPKHNREVRGQPAGANSLSTVTVKVPEIDLGCSGMAAGAEPSLHLGAGILAQVLRTEEQASRPLTEPVSSP